MTTYTTSFASNLSNITLSNDNTLTKLLGINTNNNIKYRNISSIVGNTANQSLNTTNNVTFNQITTNLVVPTATILQFLSPLITYYTGSLSTLNSTIQTILTIATATATEYLLFVEGSAYDITSAGGAVFKITKSITNDAGVLTIGQLESLSNKSTGGISTAVMTVVVSGTNILVRVTGVASQQIDWVVYCRMIAVQ